MQKAKVVSINISEKKGEIKIPIHQGTFIENFGLKEDSHAGKWHRQVSILAEESIDIMRQKGIIDLNYGDFAENITTKGIIPYKLPVGTILEIGQCTMKVSQIGKECHQGCNIMKKVGSCIMPKQGIFVTVEKGGIIKEEDEIKIVQIPEDKIIDYSLIIVSDSASEGKRQDGCKDAVEEVLDKEYIYRLKDYIIVPDEKDAIKEAIQKQIENKVPLILTSGGTGFSKRDITPEATEELIQRKTPGISEYIRAKSLEKTNRAILSRAVSGISEESLIINLPGSPIAVKESLEFIIEPLKHGLDILLAKDSNCARK